MKGKILITGASGFIGSFLAEEALHQGFEVYAGIRKSSRMDFLKQNGLHLIELDGTSPESLEKQFIKLKQEQGGFDFVVHNAGITHAKRKVDFRAVNSIYTKSLIDAVRTSGMDLKKFILIGSLASYGPGDEKSLLPVRLTDKPMPISSYGKSKLAAGQHLQVLTDFPWLIVHPTAVYGPRDKDFLQFVKLVGLGLEPYLGAGVQRISLIYVKDLARVVIQLLDHPALRRSYFVSDGMDYNKEDLSGVVKMLLKRKTIKVKVPLPALRVVISSLEKIYGLFGTTPFLNTEKLNEISHPNWLCDSRDLWNDLETTPRYLLEQGMTETIAWYKENHWLKQ